MIKELLADQTVLAILPIVTLGIIGAVVGFYWIWKDGRKQEHSSATKN